MNSKQSTLFQSWGSRSQSKNTNINKTAQDQQQKSSHSLEDLDDDIRQFISEDDDDLLLALILDRDENEAANQNSDAGTFGQAQGQSHDDDENKDGIGNISVGIEAQDIDQGYDKTHCLPQDKSSSSMEEDFLGFDHSTGQLWIYPTNYSVREYQFNIVRQALVKNTLVTLPTGLGKTFIASVVMYNFYRWYPLGKVVFMAPTKPLVAQQIEACYNIMGIPRRDTAEMTGSMNPTERMKAWRDKRVFFLTPQVMLNDLSRGTCNAEAVKCLVVDEAHKALGNHAYCQVVRELVKYTRLFRVLALSATPGSDIKAVQNVVNNLLISHIELRSEDSPDIKPYTHERIVQKIVVPLGNELLNIKAKYNQVLQTVVKRLIHQRVLYNREVSSLSKFLILKARDAFRQNPPPSLPRMQYGIVEGDFALAMSLYHGYELLQLHGLRSLFNYLDGILSGDKAYGRTRTELMKNADFNEMMDVLKEKFQPSSEASTANKTVFLAGHPKMVKLEEVVLEHFHKFEAVDQTTRVMIFSQYRDSVQEITTMLQQHEPQIKVMSFIGQSSVGKATKGFTQKEQLEVMKAFRSGDYNTLVSTCVGEEGLDIGDVDLIVCFDAHKSPVRLVQRMGRTGRKRQGRIVMLVTEGKEEQIYNHSQYIKRSIHRAILQGGAKSLVFYPHNKRMIPASLTPACHRMHITVQPAQSAAKQKGPQLKGKTKGKVTGRVSKAKSRAREKMDISLEQFVELRSLGAAVPVKHFPEHKMLTLQNHEELSPDGDDGTVMNMAEWLPWQNTLQETALMGHSRRSQHLVDLILFTDLMQALPVDEDHYGQEMGMYLNMDDVIINTRRPVSSDITQFIVQSQKSETSMIQEGKKEKHGQKHVKQTDRRTTKQKQKYEPVQVIETTHSSDDSDFLPDVDFSVTVSQPGKSAQVASNIERKQSEKHGLSPQDKWIKEKRMETSSTAVDVSHATSPESSLKQDSRTVPGQRSSCSDGRGGNEGIAGVPMPPSANGVLSLLGEFQPADMNVIDIGAMAGQNRPLPHESVGLLDLCRKPAYDDYRIKREDLDMIRGLGNLQREDQRTESLNVFNFQAMEQVLAERQLDFNRPDQEGWSEADSGSQSLSDAGRRTVGTRDAIPDELQSDKTLLFVPDSAEINLEKSFLRKTNAGALGLDTACGTFHRALPRTDTHSVKQKSERLYTPVKDTTGCVDHTPPGTHSLSVSLDMKSDTFAGNKSKTDLIQHDSENETSVDDLMTGRIKGHFDREKASTAANVDKSVHNLSVTDSFLYRNFLDDDDDDFEADTRHSPSQLKEKKNLSNTELLHRVPLSVKARHPRPCEPVTSAVTDTNSPLSAARSTSRNTSLFTFSEALSFVDNPSISDLTHSDPSKDNESDSKRQGDQNLQSSSESKMVSNTFDQSVKDDTPQVHEDEFPNFDLGFDFDEDIIPPSPEAKSLSQFSSRSVSSRSIMAATLSQSKFYKDDGINDNQGARDSDDDILPGIIEEGNEEDSPCFSSGVRGKEMSSLDKHEALLTGAVSPEAAHSQSSSFIQCSSGSLLRREQRKRTLEMGAGEEADQLEACSSPKARKSDNSRMDSESELMPSSSQGFQCSKNLDSGRDGKVDTTSKHSSVFSDFQMTHRSPDNVSKNVLMQKQTLSISGISDFMDDASFEKPKESVPDFSLIGDVEDKNVKQSASLKSPEVARSWSSVYCSTPIHGKEQRTSASSMQCRTGPASASKTLPTFALGCADDDESDFEESVIIRKKPAGGKLQPLASSDENNFTVIKNSSKRTKKKQKRRKMRCDFLDDEAELSGDVDVSSDEREDNVEMLEESFINNSTQLSQASQVDMQAVYMKSVRSPDPHQGQGRGRFRLQYNAPAVNVYSQLPDPGQEESQYQYDSFCVGSEEDESNFEYSDQEMSVMEESRKQNRVRKRKKQQHNVKQVTGRKRVHQLEDSSSNEDEDFDILPQSQVTPLLGKAAAAKALMSSSDENLDVSGTKISPNLVTGKGQEEDSSHDLNLETGKSNVSISRPVEGAGSLPHMNRAFHLETIQEHTDESSFAKSTKKVELKANPSLHMASTRSFHAEAGCKDISNSTSLNNLYAAATPVQNTSRHADRLHEGQRSGDKSAGDVNFTVSETSSANKFPTVVSRGTGKMVIFVDSREIIGAQDIVSALRLSHNAQVCTRQLAACDYILSIRLAVERLSWSYFGNGSNRNKLVERLQQMQSLYDRCVVIVEKDRLKAGEEKNQRPLHHTRYVDSVIAQLNQTSIRLFFTENQSETARVLAQLTSVECRKDFAIKCPVDLSPDKEQVIRFYLSIPQLTLPHALNLCFNFSSIHDFMRSSVNGIQTKGHMTFSRAVEVVNYVRRRFSLALSSNK